MEQVKNKIDKSLAGDVFDVEEVEDVDEDDDDDEEVSYRLTWNTKSEK